MSLTRKTIALCPPEVFYNDLDKQAMILCLDILAYVRRYKGHPCVPQETRMTLQEHVYDLVHSFVHFPEIKNVLTLADKPSPEYNFVITTISVLLRHDLGEAIFEPQTYLQKVDPTLPKINAGHYEETVAKLTYHLAQLAVAGKQEDVFIRQITGLQKNYTAFDREASAQTGKDYADYMHKTFECALESLQKIEIVLSSGIDDETLLLIQRNNDQHWQDYSLMEDPVIQAIPPAGAFAKLLDTGHLEDIHYEIEKIQNPSLDYASLSHQPNSYVQMACLRAEKPLPSFVRMTDDHPYLKPFVKVAYRLAYTRVAAMALILRPYTYLDQTIKNSEPGIYEAPENHTAFNTGIIDLIKARRNTLHPLQDDQLLSGPELAAKALCYRELCLPLEKSLLYGRHSHPELPALFDKIHADIMCDTTQDQRITRIKAICDNRLAIYVE